MASKRHRRVPQESRPKRDRFYSARKAELEEMTAKEADMEARTLGSVRRVAVVCPQCRQRSEFDLGSRVPLAMCPKCGSRLDIRPSGVPQVVNR